MKHVISHNMMIAKSTHVKQKIETISYHVIRYNFQIDICETKDKTVLYRILV